MSISEEAEFERTAQYMYERIIKDCDEPTVSALTEAMALIIEPKGHSRSPYSLSDVLMSLAFLVSGTMTRDDKASKTLRRAFALVLDDLVAKKGQR